MLFGCVGLDVRGLRTHSQKMSLNSQWSCHDFKLNQATKLLGIAIELLIGAQRTLGIWRENFGWVGCPLHPKVFQICKTDAVTEHLNTVKFGGKELPTKDSPFKSSPGYAKRGCKFKLQRHKFKDSRLRSHASEPRTSLVSQGQWQSQWLCHWQDHSRHWQSLADDELIDSHCYSVLLVCHKSRSVREVWTWPETDHATAVGPTETRFDCAFESSYSHKLLIDGGFAPVSFVY